MKEVATVGTQIIPFEERGEHVIRESEIMNADWRSLKEFEAELLKEACRRKLEITWEERSTGDIVIRWYPDRHAE
jgi:hypothetical protein